MTYGLDGAFPDSLQPALLRVYEWALIEWQRFLELDQMPAASSADAVESENQSRETTRRQARTSAIPKRRATTTETGVPSKRLHQLESPSETEDVGVQIRASDVVHNSASLANGPWAKPGEIQFYAKAPAVPWPGCVSLLLLLG